jgi:hypothetical protein
MWSCGFRRRRRNAAKHWERYWRSSINSARLRLTRLDRRGPRIAWANHPHRSPQTEAHPNGNPRSISCHRVAIKTLDSEGFVEFRWASLRPDEERQTCNRSTCQIRVDRKPAQYIVLTRLLQYNVLWNDGRAAGCEEPVNSVRTILSFLCPQCYSKLTVTC